jgi:hypothetical protein
MGHLPLSKYLARKIGRESIMSGRNRRVGRKDALPPDRFDRLRIRFPFVQFTTRLFEEVKG